MATSVHLDGPGRLFVAGPNARFVELNPLNRYLHEMVKLSPVQGSAVEIVDAGDETAIVGAANSCPTGRACAAWIRLKSGLMRLACA
jgi:hypothetical protein